MISLSPYSAEYTPDTARVVATKRPKTFSSASDTSPTRGARPHGGDRELEQVAAALGAFRERGERLRHGLRVAPRADLFQPRDLLVAHAGRDLQDVELRVFLGLVFVDPDDDVQPLVDAGLAAGGRLLDAQLRHPRLDGLGHAAEFLDLLDDPGGLADDAVGQGLDVVGARERIDHAADLAFLLHDQLRVARDAGGEVGRQADGLVEGVGVQRLGAAEHGREALEGRADRRCCRGPAP